MSLSVIPDLLRNPNRLVYMCGYELTVWWEPQVCTFEGRQGGAPEDAFKEELPMTGTVRLITDGQRERLANKMSLAIPASFTFDDAQGIIEAPKGAFEAEIAALFERKRKAANVLKPPFAGAKLVGEPVPYVGPLAIDGFEFLPVLKTGDSNIRVVEMVRRGKEDPSLARTAVFGNRDLNDVWEMRQKISALPEAESLALWPIGVSAFAVGDVWEDGNGNQCVVYVYRDSLHDWNRHYYWFYDYVSTDVRLLRRK